MSVTCADAWTTAVLVGLGVGMVPVGVGSEEARVTLTAGLGAVWATTEGDATDATAGVLTGDLVVFRPICVGAGGAALGAVTGTGQNPI